jgi:hypothetical protein
MNVPLLRFRDNKKDFMTEILRVFSIETAKQKKLII